MSLTYYLISIITGFCIFVHGRIDAHDDKTYAQSFVMNAERFIRNRCIKYGDLEQLQNILGEAEEAVKCWMQVIADYPNEIRIITQQQDVQLTNCIQGLLDKVRRCLPPGEDYLPEFLMESYKAYSKYTYENMGKLATEEELNANISLCLDAIVEYKEAYPTYACTEATKFGNDLREAPFTENDYCEDISAAHHCYREYMDQHCADMPEVRMYVGGLFEGLRAPCKEGHEEEIEAVTLQSDNDVTHFSDRIKVLIKENCLANANESQSAEALEALDNFIQLWEIRRPESKDPQERYDECMASSKNFSSYLEDLVEELVPCFEAHEGYLEQFIMASYGEYNHYFCKTFTVNEENNNKANDCMDYFEKHPENDPMVACYKNSRVFGDEHTTEPITKEKLCHDLTHVKHCYLELLNEYCPDAQELRDQYLVFVKQALKNCGK